MKRAIASPRKLRAPFVAFLLDIGWPLRESKRKLLKPICDSLLRLMAQITVRQRKYYDIYCNRIIRTGLNLRKH
jgi:hypothetical protein